MPKQLNQYGRRWYAIQTYSGYEENVANNLRQRVETMDMEDKIFAVLVPTERKVRVKNGKRKTIEEKIFPGYVLVEMLVTDDSWYVVRNTPNVTGFIGTGTAPSPISEQDIQALQKRMGTGETEMTVDLDVGLLVTITDGPFKEQQGKVAEIDKERGKVKVLVSLFGRETPVELDFLQVRKT